MKKFAIFLIFMLVYIVPGTAASPFAAYNTNTSASKFAKLPFCTDSSTSKCILLPGKSVTLQNVLEPQTLPSGETWRLTTKTYTNSYSSFSANSSMTICKAGEYLVSCGYGDDKITFDMDFLNNYSQSTDDTETEKMDALRDVWNDAGLKQEIVEKCIQERNIVCEPCPKPGTTTKSSCWAGTIQSIVLDIRTVTKTLGKNMTITGLQVLQQTFNIHQCQSDAVNTNIQTFWNCNMAKGTDNTGTYVYRDKITRTDTDCYPATTALPD